MRPTKCPRCELNYILGGGNLCSVCFMEVRGAHSADAAALFCSVCGELPALYSQDMCKSCLREMRSIDKLSADKDEDAPMEQSESKPDPISRLEEIEEVDDAEDANEAESIAKREEAVLDERIGAKDEMMADDFMVIESEPYADKKDGEP